jgi:carbon-monoxide dehydrogenase large subunit
MSAEIESAQARTQKLEGLGTRRKRVEDVRFTQGKGNYIDDLKLPGMLFGDFVRSPYGHARVKSINKDAALELPGVKGGAHRRRPEAAQAALDADIGRRCSSRIGR